MATKKIGDTTRANLMEICKAALIAAGYDVLQVASGSFGIPAVEVCNRAVHIEVNSHFFLFLSYFLIRVYQILGELSMG